MGRSISGATYVVGQVGFLDACEDVVMHDLDFFVV